MGKFLETLKYGKVKSIKMKACVYLQGDRCGVTQERLKACCPCEDYRVAPDSFWEKCKQRKVKSEEQPLGIDGEPITTINFKAKKSQIRGT